ncbi:ABC transporter ATP-binding protein [Salinirubellus sp. GCM10025818]|uniref:ABC transporter ATP-binding protein n=1 Tax=Salinirubellus TaxID=2162630 RepID=UPI0030CE6B54
MSAVIETEGLERRFGMLVAVDDVSVSINEGEITSIIGPNGAGKSTFYNLLAGQLKPTEGDVRIRPREGGALVDVTDMEPFEINRLGLSRGFQINNVFDGLSVTDNIRIARISHDERTLDLTALARQDEQLTAEVLEVIDLVGLEEIADTECANLSHGDKRKVEIALALASDPSVVLLDEPTAGMNATETRRMVDLIRRLDEETDTTFVVTEHDMEVVLGISDRILVLDRGSLIADGTPEEVMADERVREAYLGLDADEEVGGESGSDVGVGGETA